MSEWSRLFFGMIVDLFRSRAALEAEIVVLRQQLNVLRRACPKKLPFNSIDRLILGGACRPRLQYGYTYQLRTQKRYGHPERSERREGRLMVLADDPDEHLDA